MFLMELKRTNLPAMWAWTISTWAKLPGVTFKIKKTCSDVSKIRMITPMMMAWSRKNESSVKDDGDNTNDEGDGDDRKQKFFQI